MCRPSTKDGRAREEVSFSWKRGNSAFEKKEETKTFSAVTKFCGFMEQVSVRICCEDTEVAAVA